MSVYAVIDSNVLVSSLLSRHDDAATVRVVARMLAGEIVPLYSAQTLAEYREVLGRRKFGFAEETVRHLLLAVERFGVLVEPTPTGISLPDAKDVPFYEVALEREDDDARLVTGNLRHFPGVPFVVTPRQMLDILDAGTA